MERFPCPLWVPKPGREMNFSTAGPNREKHRVYITYHLWAEKATAISVSLNFILQPARGSGLGTSDPSHTEKQLPRSGSADYGDRRAVLLRRTRLKIPPPPARTTCCLPPAM